jgi:uncharacterized protein YlzI (FlbEa/FlbD family)
VTLVDGKRYVVVEAVEAVIDRIRAYRASVIALAQRIETGVPDSASLHLVPLETQD